MSEYTVQKLAKLSGISVRTLHYYDEIGLLKPAFYKTNGYRFYKEEQLLLLQQILFFRELGLSLTGLKKILHSSNFDKISALKSHREILVNNMSRAKKLIDTIDKTVVHLQGKTLMEDYEIFEGFSEDKRTEYEGYFVEKYGEMAKKILEEKKRVTKNWTKEDFVKVVNEYNNLNKKFTELLNKNIAPETEQVQQMVKLHYEFVKKFYQPSKDLYANFIYLHIEVPEIRKIYDMHHPELVEYLAKAIQIYANKNL